METAPEHTGNVGILPVGALGVGFYFHLTQQLGDLERSVYFIERTGSATRTVLLEKGALSIATPTEVRTVPVEKVCKPTLLACAEAGWLPEILLVCTQSDQLLPVIGNYVELLEWLYTSCGLELAMERLPILVLCSNGIYHQRVRRFLVEALEEATLFGRLPDLWSQPMGQIVGKLVRGVTIQTGLREGTGAEAIFRPGPPGLTRLAGGDLVRRKRTGEILKHLGGWFEVAETDSPTRVEFDKALVNLFGNLLGQFTAIDDAGDFRLVTMGEILPEPETPETRELARHVFEVGRAVQAYRPDEDFGKVYEMAMNRARGPRHHVPSSIQWLGTQLEAGLLQAKVTPTEKWLLEPLLRYASTAGLEESAAYFIKLNERIEERLALAIEKRRCAK